MKRLLREIDGDSDPEIRCRLLGFKEFCTYVYEPSMKNRPALNGNNSTKELTNESVKYQDMKRLA